LARQAERFLRYRLTREIAQQAWGDAGEFEKARPFDTQLQRALEVLSRARSTEDLFRQAAAAGGAQRATRSTEAAPGG
jgi:hypothetical protein